MLLLGLRKKVCHNRSNADATSLQPKGDGDDEQPGNNLDDEHTLNQENKTRSLKEIRTWSRW